MNKKTSYLILFLLLVAAFLAGAAGAKIKYGGEAKERDRAKEEAGETAGKQLPTPIPFNPKKSGKPEVKFFVMSFCPYGNQAEAGLEPVYRLLKDQVDWQPRYIVSDKKASCEQNCPLRVYDENRCKELVEAKRVSDMESCKSYFPYKSADECLQKECVSLKAGAFDSLHGQQELNQDVREICAFQQSVGVGSGVLGASLVESESRRAKSEGLLDKWWKFVAAVNSKCTADNVDACWKEQAKAVGLDTAKVSSCFQSQAKTLLSQELAQAQKYQVSGSPTVIINDSLYNGGRSPEDYKKAVCLAFEAPPEECKQILGQETSATSGGCGQ